MIGGRYIIYIPIVFFMKMFIYDFEVFKHDWLVVFKDYFRKEYTIIVNDPEHLTEFYEYHKNDLFIGYNCNHYDKFIFNWLLSKKSNPYMINRAIIDGKNVYQYFDRKYPIVQYDVMTADKFHGLKTLELFMGSNIKESEVDFNINRKLTKEEIDETIYYCKHDVDETEKVFELRADDFSASVNIIKTFNLPFSTSIHKTKAQLTADVLKCRKRLRNDRTNFSIIDSIDLGKYKSVAEPLLSGSVLDGEKHNCVISGIPHILGLGGIHGAIDHCCKFVTDDKWLILHVDVASYYPRLMIFHDLLTRNASNKNDYKKIFDTRLKLKAEGKKQEQAPYKILLNSTYGICNDKFSTAYDPRRALEICINGQLMLIDLIDKLESIDNFELIQSNTDGLIVKIPRSAENELKEICSEWETRNKMILEYDYIKQIIQRDVNNYLAEFDNGQIEAKGSDVKFNSILDNDMSIKNIAIREYLLHNIPVEQTINKYENDYIKFQQLVKKSSKYDYLLYGNRILNGKVQRVFASPTGEGIYKQKIGKNKEKYANTSTNCVIINNELSTINHINIDYSWYIDYINTKLEKWRY